MVAVKENNILKTAKGRIIKTNSQKCANCKEEHPDNLRGSIIAKMFQERRNLAVQVKTKKRSRK